MYIRIYGMLILRKKIFLILYPPFENSTTYIAKMLRWLQIKIRIHNQIPKS